MHPLTCTTVQQSAKITRQTQRTAQPRDCELAKDRQQSRLRPKKHSYAHIRADILATYRTGPEVQLGSWGRIKPGP